MTKASKTFWFGLLTLAGLGIFSLSQCERPVLDYMDEYDVIHFLRDENTGKIIELGVLHNFGSTEYEVGVYDTPRPDRTSRELHQQQLSVVASPGPDPLEVQFDGKCYFLSVTYRKEWTTIRPIWVDPVRRMKSAFTF